MCLNILVYFLRCNYSYAAKYPADIDANVGTGCRGDSDSLNIKIDISKWH